MTDVYYRISKPAQGEYRNRGSRFFGKAFPLNLPEDVKTNLKALKTEYPDATHICYAYRMMTTSGIDEYSTDAGEPSGSSGSPILNVIRRHRMVDTAIYVIRYFGGTKLGIPGLINAYGTCAENCIGNAHIIPWVKMHVLTTHYPYEYQRIVDSLIRQFDCFITHQNFREEISAEIKVKEENFDEFSQQLSDKTRGKVHAEIVR